MRILLLVMIVSVACPVLGQSVQWASSVVGFSSEGKGEAYSQQFKAIQALGKPNRLPVPGESPCAWSPALPESQQPEWITVRFDTLISIRQIVVAEAGMPGAITEVLVITPQGREVSVYKPAGPGSPAPAETLLRIFPTVSDLRANTVKVVMAPAKIPGRNQIDAIGISSDSKPIQIGIRLAPNVPADITKENLGPTINTKGQEVAPVITPDGKTLFFTRGDHPKNIGNPEEQDVWYAKLEAGNTWSEAVNLGPPINNAGANAVSGISLDGKTIYLINIPMPDGTTRFGLSRSSRGPNGWSFPSEYRIKNNYNIHKYTYTEYSITPDGRTMILSVQRRDSQGNKDLYVCFLQSDQSWTEPAPLGPDINTADYEGAPFIAADGKTLYFTSSGRPEFGRGDIFVSRRLDDSWKRWSEPENLGSGINTPEWDGYLTIPAAGDYAYLSSSQNSFGDEDIFRIKLPPSLRPEPVAIVSGQILDASSRRPLAGEVVAGIAGETRESARAEFDPKTGDYKLILPVQQNYTLTARKDGYFPTSERVDLSREKRFRDIRKNLYLVPIQAGQKIVMREVLFEQSQAELLPGSSEELDRVVDMMRAHPSMQILVEGHTDNQGDWNLNLRLSEDRVAVVKQYLSGKGITASRIQTKAWGPSKPVASNETEEKRRLNRRVEFTILQL